MFKDVPPLFVISYLRSPSSYGLGFRVQGLGSACKAFGLEEASGGALEGVTIRKP